MKLTDVCDFQGGSQPPKEEWSFEEQDGYIRMLQIRDFTQSEKVIPEYIKVSNSTKTCEVDDILIARYGASIGKILTGLAGAYNVAIMRTIPDTSKVQKRYLYYYLRSPYFQNAILNVGSRAAQAGFNKEDLSKLEIECPALIEQDEIVSVLEKVESVIQKRKQELKLLDDLIKARFVEMFGSIHDSREYPYVAVKDLTDVIRGGTPSRDYIEYWENGTIPWVKTTELQNNVITSVDEYITTLGLAESSAKLVPAGTVLVAMYGQGKTRGMTAYLDIEASTNQACACILPSEKIESMFLWKYFELSYDKLRSLAQGAGQPNLNGNMIKNFKVLVPPIAMQKDYINFVKQVDKSKVIVQKALDETQTLFDSLMQEYFG